MLYLSFIWHMHQPFYNNLLTNEASLPWVRLHGVKDYLDMVTILGGYPKIHQTFNLVPSLIEQINSLVDKSVKDRFYILSEKEVTSLNSEEKKFIVNNFFMSDEKKVIAMHPRYYELFFQAKAKKEFSEQDILDLQVWFNLAWVDPYYRESIKELNNLVRKGRFFSEDDKRLTLEKHLEILNKIVPTYKRYQESGKIEVSISPFYHPILPLLINSKIARLANRKAPLPNTMFKYRKDCYWHIDEAVSFYKNYFGLSPQGMWPSEEAISRHIMPLLIKSGIKWIVSDEALILRTLKKKTRDSETVYQSYKFDAKNGHINILFRDGNLSNLISFLYQHWEADRAVEDFMSHLKNINDHFNGNDCLVVIALDGENAWEYYRNDGRDFLKLLYSKISDSKFIKAVTVSEYLNLNITKNTINKIAAGSWINGDFTKWMGNPVKNRAWELLAEARDLLDQLKITSEIAWKQIHILEGSDWFWWYGDKQRQFDELFRMHLKNFYKIINQKPKVDLDQPLE